MAAILTPRVVRRIAGECTDVDERGAVGIRLEPAAAIYENQDGTRGSNLVSSTGESSEPRSCTDPRSHKPALVDAGCCGCGILGTNRSARVGIPVGSPALTDEFGETDSVFSGDHLGCLLANHDRGCVGVAADHRRHDAGIRHPQPFDTVDP